MMLYTAHTKEQFDSLLGELPSLSDELGPKAADALFMYSMRLMYSSYINGNCSTLHLTQLCSVELNLFESDYSELLCHVTWILNGIVKIWYPENQN